MKELNVYEIRMDERRRIVKEINKHIKRGSLEGNGCDQQAQRNGLILATNIISSGIINSK